MATIIPDTYRDLLEKPVIVSLATTLPDGSVTVTPVWRDFDGSHIRINTDARRLKYQNMVQRPTVTVLAVDPENPYRYLEVRGKVTHTSAEGASEHIDKLSQDYTNVQPYPWHTDDEQRVICYIEPEKVIAHG
ncbi:MAG TPA: PPOX class F420-dependent oxidoreductase [Ktedonobacterales bacterium]